MSFNEIAKDIINNPKYKELKKENHHGLTRYDHSMRVAKSTYKMSKKLGVDYVTATRAALLHDFYTESDFADVSSSKKLYEHPFLALKNSEEYFQINHKEANAIKTHMWPLSLGMPASKEAVILNIADKGVAIYECSRFKLSTAVGIWLLFVFNFITFTNN